MSPFIEKHLKGIPFANFYGTEYSFFDHAKRFCEGMIVLREHFRCMPEIIEFSNKLFYAPDGKGLYPLKQYSENRLEPLLNVHCINGVTEGSGQSIRNEPEAIMIANKISELVKDDRYRNKTFGVISLQGNSQSALIENLILKNIGEREYKERKFLCGNSASFQGDERDIIILSLVTALNHNRSALTRSEDERRYNVAVSRAIEQVWLFHSVTLADLSNTNDLRYKILDHFINYKPIVPPIREVIKRMPGNQPPPFDSWFEVDVFNEIIQRGYNVIPQYEVARGRYRIDLVAIFSDGTKIAIECDGDKWHGAEEYQNDILRQKVLERCGWQFFRVRGGDFYSNRENALNPLWKIFEQKKESEIAQNSNVNVFTENEEPEISENVSPLEKTETVYNILTSDNDVLFTFQEFLIFTDKFNVYKVINKRLKTVIEIINSIDKEEPDEKIIYITGTSDFKGYMLFGFENGKIAKVFLESYKTLTNRKKLKNAYSDLSRLVYIDKIEYDIDIAVISSTFKVIVFNTDQINPKESKSTQGNQVIKINASNNMFEAKRITNVTFKSIEYYRKNIPATGNYLLPHDEF
jgi:very-short-patch-repair endonuclease